MVERSAFINKEAGENYGEAKRWALIYQKIKQLKFWAQLFYFPSEFFENKSIVLFQTNCMKWARKHNFRQLLDNFARPHINLPPTSYLL